MLLQISTTHHPATDLGYLLHKHPDRPVTFPVSAGEAHVLWPDARPDLATCALLLDVDPVALVRGKGGPDSASGPLAQYVNDRPYVASSFLSSALTAAFRSALNGSCRERPDLVDQPLPLTLRLDVVPVRGGPSVIDALFGPLGYAIEAERLPLDEAFPAWGDSALYRLTLRHTLPVRDALRHLYVLVPVLDDRKHYWVGTSEVEQLVTKGQAWLEDHPARDTILRRALRRQRTLIDAARDQLVSDAPEPVAEASATVRESALEKPLSLDVQRRQAVVDVLRASGAHTVADLGCGEGKLLRALLQEPSFTRVIGVDVSQEALQRAAARLKLDTMPERVASRLTLLHGSLTYRDARLDGLDAAACVEVIEHLDPERLDAFAAVVFGTMRPRTVVLTTPNIEYNVRFPTLPAGRLRHPDHRFEWTRAACEAWCTRVAQDHGYTVRFDAIGAVDPEVGAPTQLAEFTRCP